MPQIGNLVSYDYANLNFKNFLPASPGGAGYPSVHRAYLMGGTAMQDQAELTFMSAKSKGLVDSTKSTARVTIPVFRDDPADASTSLSKRAGSVRLNISVTVDRSLTEDEAKEAYSRAITPFLGVNGSMALAIVQGQNLV